MPESIESYVGSGGHRGSAAVTQSILSTYRDDFAKYGRRVDRQRLDKVFTRIPHLVGEKFKYSQVDREEGSRELRRALHLRPPRAGSRRFARLRRR